MLIMTMIVMMLAMDDSLNKENVLASDKLTVKRFRHIISSAVTAVFLVNDNTL